MTAAPRLILVTGASGFIGRHLCAALASRGDSVRALYRRKEPPPELLALAATRGGESGSAGGSSCSGPISATRRESARQSSGVDAVIHSAALASDWGDLESFIKANYDATSSLLEAARESGCGPSSISAPPSSTDSDPTSTRPSEGPTTPSNTPTRSAS